ncbi:peptide/nickel transport system permease protein [Robbsia andropogonis]|uniref:ABC transporter permease n=1 Tax=Robbsia andropogonis TaxID=28092 RepID=UPI003D24C2E5
MGWGLKRLVSAGIVIVVAAIGTFLLARLLPGDPVAHLASGIAANAEGLAALRHRLGLDVPVSRQLGRYLLGLCRGDWGRSYATGEPVLRELRDRLPASLELTLVGLLLSTIIGIPLGIAAASRRSGPVAVFYRWLTSAGIGLPSFVIGLLLIHIFYFRLGWAPEPSGRIDAFAIAPPYHTGFFLIDAWIAHDGVLWRDAFRHLLLPAATMALFGMAPLARMTCSAMQQALDSAPVRTARSLDLPPWRVLRDYTLAQAAAPIVTAFGMVASYLLAANIAVERVFTWPGIGTYALDALAASDYPALQGFILMVAILFAVWNMLIDCLTAVLDPRVAEIER